MLVVVGGRQCGKTQQLVEWVTDRPGRAILCISFREADRLRTTYGLSADQATYPGRASGGGPRKEIAIDNAEHFLRALIDPVDDLALVSLTGPENVLAATDEDADSGLSFTESEHYRG